MSNFTIDELNEWIVNARQKDTPLIVLMDRVRLTWEDLIYVCNQSETFYQNVNRLLTCNEATIIESMRLHVVNGTANALLPEYYRAFIESRDKFQKLAKLYIQWSGSHEPEDNQ